MKPLICWSCTKVKGKRNCPAHGGKSICSKCCGSKRQGEINCPQDCPYLHGTHDPLWASSSHQAENVRFLTNFGGLEVEGLPVLMFLHHILLQAKRDTVKDLTDEETLDVLSTLTRTYETLSKGIYYEHKSESSRSQTVIGWSGRVLEKRKEIEGSPPATDTEILAGLNKISSAVRTYREQNQWQQNYLDTAERVFRSGLAQVPEIKIPGETDKSNLLI